MFKKACEQWHARFCRSMRGEKSEEESRLLEQHVARYAEQWKKHMLLSRRRAAQKQAELDALKHAEASAERRYRLLRELHAVMRKGIRKEAQRHSAAQRAERCLASEQESAQRQEKRTVTSNDTEHRAAGSGGASQGGDDAVHS